MKREGRGKWVRQQQNRGRGKGASTNSADYTAAWKNYVVNGSLLLASSVAFRNTRERAEKLSYIVPRRSDSYLLLGPARLAVAAASAEKRCCCVPCIFAGKGRCAAATVRPGTEGFPFHWVQSYLLLSFTWLTQGLLFVWFFFLKLVMKLGHCSKQLLCQLLRHYFWITKLSEFSKSSWEKSWCCSMWSALSSSEIFSYQHLW